MTERIQNLLNSLTLRQKVAQLISSRVLSSFVNEESKEYRRVLRLVRDVQVGGITFFQGNVPGQVFYTNRLQAAAQVPLLVAQDTENGLGMRLPDATILPHMMAVGATGSTDASRTAARVIANEASSMGVHHIFAPVCDVNTNPDNPIINTRSFGSDPAFVGAMATACIDELQSRKVIATAKHFPGHGDTAIDTHLNLATLLHDRTRLEDVELIPFREAIDAGVRSIMVGHLSVPSLDDSGVPASLSKRIVGDLLRGELGYDGLVVTDALDMQAITNTYGPGEAAVMAVEAGIDMLLLVADEDQAIEAIMSALESGRLHESRINDAVRRILVEKEWSGALDNEPISIDNVFEKVASVANQAAAVEIAENAVCRLSQSEVRPLDISDSSMVLVIKDDLCSKNGKRFLDSLGSVRNTGVITAETSETDLERLVEKAHDSDALAVLVFLSVRSYSGHISFPKHILDFLNRLGNLGQANLVLMGSPYLYSLLEVSCPVVATCSTSPASETAAARVLTGDIECRGSLPVELPE